MSKANEKQVAGQHYRAKIQHWDFVVAAGLGYFEGQITKYVTRWRKKNGVQDLQKAEHFLEKLIEVERRAVREPPILRNPLMGTLFFEAYCEQNGLDPTEKKIIWKVAAWENLHDLRSAQSLLQFLVGQEDARKEESPEPTVDGADRCAHCHHAEVTHADGGACMTRWVGGSGKIEACTCHGFTPDDGSAPGPGYVDQDR